MPEFDCGTAAKRLAEMERLRKSLPDFASDSPGSVGTQSMEAVFPALRVECWHGRYIQQFACWPCTGSCDHCQGRGWVPEPDVRIACWEVFCSLRGQFRFDNAVAALWRTVSEEEAVLRAAEAWAKEQHGRQRDSG